MLTLGLVTAAPAAAVVTYYDVDVDSNEGLSVDISGSYYWYATYDASGTTYYTEADVPETSSVTLTAPAIWIEDSTFYVFDEWIVVGATPTYYDMSVDFVVSGEATATVYYTKVISVDKTLEWCGKYVETVTVHPDDDDPAYPGSTTDESTNVLESGKSYLLIASGTYMFWPSQPHEPGTIDALADAEYSQRPTDGNWEDLGAPLPAHILDIAVDGANIDWGPYNAEHVYYYLYTGTGAKVYFSIYDNDIADNIGFLTVDIYEVCEPDAVPLGEVVNFSMTITVHAYEDVTGVNVEDGIGADLVVDEVGGEVVVVEGWEHNGKWATWSDSDVTLTRNTKGKMNATRLDWDLDTPTPCTDYELEIVVHTGLNPKDKQEYTSTGVHELNSGPIVYFTYDGTMYILQGPPVSVNVVGDED